MKNTIHATPKPNGRTKRGVHQMAEESLCESQMRRAASTTTQQHQEQAGNHNLDLAIFASSAESDSSTRSDCVARGHLVQCARTLVHARKQSVRQQQWFDMQMQHITWYTLLYCCDVNHITRHMYRTQVV